MTGDGAGQVELERVPPRPEVLVESLRDIGYQMTTAVADVIDNSITAGARRIDLRVDTSDATPALAVIDDGCGMTRDELREAMRAGSRSPREARARGDLGRFGLGLKTASFSQCRRLTVLTRRDGRISGAVWDLDLIAERGDWLIEWVGDPGAVRWSDLLPERGTMVLWEKLDRPSAADSGRTFTRLVEEVGTHLGLAFHRFLAAEGGRPSLRMTLNGRAIEPEDPFAEWHPATVRAAEETIPYGPHRAVVQAFTLPHHVKCKGDGEWDRIGGDLGHMRAQGFYLYRGRRLILRGTWFRLARQTDLTKLSRVRIDIDNDGDAEWGIDVRKSSASPPPAVRERLGRLIETIGGASKRAYRARGAILTDDNPLPVWSRLAGEGGASYDLNGDHPTIARLADRLGEDGAADLRRALRLIASSLPLDALLHDLSSTPRGVTAGSIDEDEVEATAREAIGRLTQAGMAASDAGRMLACVPPYRDHPAALRRALDAYGDV